MLSTRYYQIRIYPQCYSPIWGSTMKGGPTSKQTVYICHRYTMRSAIVATKDTYIHIYIYIFIYICIHTYMHILYGNKCFLHKCEVKWEQSWRRRHNTKLRKQWVVVVVLGWWQADSMKQMNNIWFTKHSHICTLVAHKLNARQVSVTLSAVLL